MLKSVARRMYVNPILDIFKISFASFVSEERYQVHLDMSVIATCIVGLSRISRPHESNQDVLDFHRSTSVDNWMGPPPNDADDLFKLHNFFQERIADFDFFN